jgi:hypothetical protein
MKTLRDAMEIEPFPRHSGGMERSRGCALMPSRGGMEAQCGDTLIEDFPLLKTFSAANV